MKIRVFNDYFTIEEASQEEREQLSLIATLPTKDPEKIFKFNSKIPVYFLKKLQNYEIIDCSITQTVEISDDISLYDIELRDYQEEAIKSTRKAPRGYIQLPTGSGKTVIMAGIIKQFKIPKTLVLAGTNDLCKQLKNNLERLLNEWVGLVDKTTTDYQKITVTTYASFIKKFDSLLDYDMLIIDEAHHLTGLQLLNAVILHPAYRKYGFSSTIDIDKITHEYVKTALSMFEKGKIIEGQYLYKKNYTELEGFYPTIEFLIGKLNYERFDIPDYALGNKYLFYKKMVVENFQRNLCIAKICSHCLDLLSPTLILVAQKRHAIILQKLIKHISGIEIPIIESSTKASYRQEIINNLDSYKGVIATTIWDEGIDLKSLRSIVIASGQASAIKAIQRVGRGLRKQPGKETFTVVDFLDLTMPELNILDLKRFRSYAKLFGNTNCKSVTVNATL